MYPSFFRKVRLLVLLPQEMSPPINHQCQMPMVGEAVLLAVSLIQDGARVLRLVGVGVTGGESPILLPRAVVVAVLAVILLEEIVTLTEFVNRTDALLSREGSLHPTVVVAQGDGVADVHRLIPGREAHQDGGVRVMTDEVDDRRCYE